MFPTFSIYSIPLAILYLWGVVFFGLLLIKYFKGRNIADLFLAFILLLHTYERTTYTLGFMAWYDNFPYTKINYFLIPSLLLLGPLIYFYTRSVTQAGFSFTKKHLWHFAPQIIYTLYRIGVYIYDVQQKGFEDVQNGVFFNGRFNGVLEFIVVFSMQLSMAIYLVASIFIYLDFKKRNNQLFSNLSKVGLLWLRNFLLIFTTLFLIMLILGQIDDELMDLTYTDFWWGHLLAALALVYLGIYGYLFDVDEFHQIEKEAGFISLKEKTNDLDQDFSETLHQLEHYMAKEKPYLDQELTLSTLAKALHIPSGLLSSTINKGKGLNFNDYINGYRIEEIKKQLQAGKADQFSLLAIAYECGFNSKATFNRIFKKFEGIVPSEYLKSL